MDTETPTIILAALYLFEQILASSKCKSNSTAQLITNFVKHLSIVLRRQSRCDDTSVTTNCSEGDAIGVNSNLERGVGT